MTRFIFLADTHLGANPMGYTQQPGYPERIGELIPALESLVRDVGGVDVILHGGDMVDTASARAISDAAALFPAALPVRLCLGNHDLSCDGALDLWMRHGARFFPGGEPDYTIAAPGCAVHVLTTHWSATPFLWKDTLDEHFLHGQLDWLDEQVRRCGNDVQMLVTHSPARGVPPDQTGLAEPLHPPTPAFQGTIDAILRRHPQIRCVLGAHTHMNMNAVSGSIHRVTVSSFVETPFECKLFEVEQGKVSMTTVSLAGRLSFKAEYDAAKHYVQGREQDRKICCAERRATDL